MTSDDELIARVRDGLQFYPEFDEDEVRATEALQALQQLTDRLGRLRDGLERIAHPIVPPWANFTHQDAARWRQQAFIEFGEIAREALATSKIQPPAQEEKE